MYYLVMHIRLCVKDIVIPHIYFFEVINTGKPLFRTIFYELFSLRSKYIQILDKKYICRVIV
jgi:hypothetical protein